MNRLWYLLNWKPSGWLHLQVNVVESDPEANTTKLSWSMVIANPPSNIWRYSD